MTISNPHVERLYECHIQGARVRITQDPTLAKIVAPDAERQAVLGFLIQFSALGVRMTESVEQWISRAGQRCVEIGLTEVGGSLIKHAHHEAGHHEMMISDLDKLLVRWNAEYEPKLEASVLLSQAGTDSMQRYVDIHERTIASDHPYAQVAIELEIERMSTVLGPALLDACQRTLGAEIVGEMSFIDEHAALDVGHTTYNTRVLEQLLEARPDAGPAVAEIGAEALGIYLDFLGDCVRKGSELNRAA